jgi:hypothetical protein
MHPIQGARSEEDHNRGAIRTSNEQWGQRDLNPHDLAVNGFSYHYSFHCHTWDRCVYLSMFVVWTMPLPFSEPFASQVGAV